MVEVDELQQLRPTEKKRHIKSGFLNYEETIKKGGHFMQSISCEQFHPYQTFSWDSKSEVPEVFQLNKPLEQQNLLGSMTHLQPSNKPFDLNFEIPRLSEHMSISSFLTHRQPLAESKLIPTPQLTQESETNTSKELSFFELLQGTNIKRPKYWEDLSDDQMNSQAVELQPIQIKQKFDCICQLKSQGLVIISQKQYIQFVIQMLLGFQNEYFVYDLDQLSYIQQQTIYVEDMTSLQQITQKFIELANYIQRLRFYLLTPSNTILRSKINTILQSFVDEMEQKILQITILDENMTILHFQIYTKHLNKQIKIIFDIFTADDCNLVNKALYERIIQINQRDEFLVKAFYELNNFQLDIFAKGINSQDVELQIPQHFPSQFSSTYANTVQSLALITQLKVLKIQHVEEILNICQISELYLQSNLKQKNQYIQTIYKSKEQNLKEIIRKYHIFITEKEQQEQIKRKIEFQRIQMQVRIQKQKYLESQQAKQISQKNQKNELLVQIEVNRINRKYNKLIENQEERNLQLEQELNEKKKLQKEKEQLLMQLADLGINIQDTKKNNEIQIELNPTPIQLITKKAVDNLIIETPNIQNIEEQLLTDNLLEQTNDNHIIEEQIEKQHDSNQITQIKQENQQKFEEELQDNCQYSFQLQLEVCIGMHARLHNQLVNKSIHFLLFEQLNFLQLWNNIKKYYFTSDGDFVDQNIFQLIDNENNFIPNQLTEIDIFPKLKSKSKLARERQGFYECQISDQLQIKIESKAQLLKACFTNSILQQILIFFDQILKLRYCSNNLRRNWKYIQFIKDPKIANSYGMLRYQMQTFIDIYQNYIFYDVLESTWNDFKQQLTNAKSVDEIINVESNYLNKILETTLLKSDKKIIKESYNQCQQMINQFIQILEFQYNFGLIQKQPPDISKLSQNFKKQSDFFSKFITWLKDPTTFDRPV
ncbi:unnamed protein product [Paramecium primaurelia]|uniref:Spindle pole body component n=1 Tax=Paramecium primaurelia TaxID=5886 RepID=A0A8S1LW47_PARPR|nr:unnamed protein product [Paramecium primaurelia]